jgi:hypothetical protein
VCLCPCDKVAGCCTALVPNTWLRFNSMKLLDTLAQHLNKEQVFSSVTLRLPNIHAIASSGIQLTRQFCLPESESDLFEQFKIPHDTRSLLCHLLSYYGCLLSIFISRMCTARPSSRPQFTILLFGLGLLGGSMQRKALVSKPPSTTQHTDIQVATTSL